MLSKEDFELYSGKESFKEVLKSKLKKSRYDSLIDVVHYGSELLKLQAELVDLQQWAAKHKKRVCVCYLREEMPPAKAGPYVDLQSI